jgi:hypothetical protein
MEGILILLFLFIWVTIGLVAKVMSLICFGFQGDITDKFIGLLIAFIFGPFYWFFYAYNMNYCY